MVVSESASAFGDRRVFVKVVWCMHCIKFEDVIT